MNNDQQITFTEKIINKSEVMKQSLNFCQVYTTVLQG
jgi:hypothetical protein